MIILQCRSDTFFIVQLFVDLILLNMRAGNDSNSDFVTIGKCIEQFRSNTQTDQCCPKRFDEGFREEMETQLGIYMEQ